MTTNTIAPASRPDLSGWQQRSLHTVTCPSGQRVRIRIAGLGTILESGDLPDDLIDIALLELSHEFGAAGAIARDLADEEITDEKRERALRRMREFGQLQRHLACDAVRAVEIDGEWQPVRLETDDLDALPEDDLAMIAEIVQRLRATDARGVRIGVEPLDRWATFREAHGCADQDCEGCAKVVRALSSSDVGEV